VKVRPRRLACVATQAAHSQMERSYPATFKVRGIVAPPPSALDRVAWAHPVAAVIEQLAGEERVRVLAIAGRGHCHVRSFYLSIARAAHHLHVEISWRLSRLLDQPIAADPTQFCEEWAFGRWEGRRSRRGRYGNTDPDRRVLCCDRGPSRPNPHGPPVVTPRRGSGCAGSLPPGERKEEGRGHPAELGQWR
jgi:hypothetical protein